MKSHQAKKSLGQNFLIDGNIQRKIVQAALVANPSHIIEIGPGQGALTQHLLKENLPLTLIEKDHHLADELQKKHGETVRVITGDFLKIDFSTLGDEVFTFVGNLPYNVSSQILLKILHATNLNWSSLVFMFQKEVARRCVAKAGSDDYGILGVQCEIFSEAELLFDVPPTVFRPQPKVWSSVVRFKKRQEVSFEQEKGFVEFVRKAFGQRRKKLGTVLKISQQNREFFPEHIKEMLEKRAEVLGLAELKGLYQVLKNDLS